MGGTNTTGGRRRGLGKLGAGRSRGFLQSGGKKQRLRETGVWAGHITQFRACAVGACLTDLQRGRRHHVLSGGRRWPLSLDRAAAMVMAGRSGDERRRARVEGSEWGGEWDGTGSQGWPGPGPAEARAARLQRRSEQRRAREGSGDGDVPLFS